jgi:PAS domain S-box-containing protein
MRNGDGLIGTDNLEILANLMAGSDGLAGAFRQILESLPIAVYTTDAAGRLTYFNSAARKLSGRTPELGTDTWCVTWKLFFPDGTPLPHDQCPMATALKGGEVPNGIECIAERPDGSRFWFTPYPSVLRNGEGRIIGGVNLLVDITYRKIAEIEANEQLRAVIETTPECVKIVAPDGALLFMNPPGLEMIGASSAEVVIGNSVYSIIAPEDRERFRQFNERVCGGERGSLQFEIVGLNGVRRHMESHAAPFRQSDGRTVHLAITHDITERKRTERAAHLLSAIVDSSDDAVVSKDLGGIVTSWNTSAERIFGYTAEEAVGQPIATLIIPPDRQDEEPKILARLRKGERVDHFETVRRRKDGTLLDISVTISPVRDAGGKIIGASKIARDITERKRMQAALIASEGRFRQLADTMPQIVWTARGDGYIDYYNERWYQFTGSPRDVFGDASWVSILHPDDLARTKNTWSDAIETQTPYNIEYRLWDRHENRWRWFVGRAVPVHGADGTITKWFGTCTDIDEQKRIQDDLRRANQDLEQFAFSASHDLQEPLRAVKIYTELLAKRHSEKLDGEAQEFMQFVRNGATRMETLVRDLLAYTQISKFDKAKELANASEALDGALQNLSGVIAEAGAQINADSLPAVRVHGLHLQQLFQNLVGNAIKYRSPGRVPEVHVGVERQGDDWLFSVSDNGIGIDRKYQAIIFGLFKRLHHETEYAGTGIGLAICQRIVDRYDGRIWVESEPGRGSTFRFTLPA